jgi:hypothetical protein
MKLESLTRLQKLDPTVFAAWYRVCI